MPADLHDHNQLPAVLTTQVTPVNYQTPGALTTVTSVIISTPVASSQLSTQDNNFSGGITNWGWQQVAANATTYPLQSPLINQSPGVIGSATVATRDAMGFLALDGIDAVLRGERPKNLV